MDTDFEFIASDKQLTEDESRLKDMRGSYDEVYGFHDDNVNYVFKSEKRSHRRNGAAHQRHEK